MNVRRWPGQGRLRDIATDGRYLMLTASRNRTHSGTQLQKTFSFRQKLEGVKLNGPK